MIIIIVNIIIIIIIEEVYKQYKYVNNAFTLLKGNRNNSINDKYLFFKYINRLTTVSHISYMI